MSGYTDALTATSRRALDCYRAQADGARASGDTATARAWERLARELEAFAEARGLPVDDQGTLL